MANESTSDTKEYWAAHADSRRAVAGAVERVKRYRESLRAQEILADREAELRLVNLHPRGAVRLQQGEHIRLVVAPAAVPQFDGHRVVAERLQQPGEVLGRVVAMAKTRRELRQQRTQFPGAGQRVDRRRQPRDDAREGCGHLRRHAGLRRAPLSQRCELRRNHLPPHREDLLPGCVSNLCVVPV